jgi:hypothetical protein
VTATGDLGRQCRPRSRPILARSKEKPQLSFCDSKKSPAVAVERDGDRGLALPQRATQVQYIDAREMKVAYLIEGHAPPVSVFWGRRFICCRRN